MRAALAILAVLGIVMARVAFGEILSPIEVACQAGFTAVPIKITDASTVTTIGSQARNIVSGILHAPIEVNRWQCFCTNCFNQNTQSIDVEQESCVLSDCIRQQTTQSKITDVANTLVFWEFKAQVPNEDDLANSNRAATIEKIYQLFDTHQSERAAAITEFDIPQDAVDISLTRTSTRLGSTSDFDRGTECNSCTHVNSGTGFTTENVSVCNPGWKLGIQCPPSVNMNITSNSHKNGLFVPPPTGTLCKVNLTANVLKTKPCNLDPPDTFVPSGVGLNPNAVSNAANASECHEQCLGLTKSGTSKYHRLCKFEAPNNDKWCSDYGVPQNCKMLGFTDLEAALGGTGSLATVLIDKIRALPGNPCDTAGWDLDKLKTETWNNEWGGWGYSLRPRVMPGSNSLPGAGSSTIAVNGYNVPFNQRFNAIYISTGACCNSPHRRHLILPVAYGTCS